MSNWNRAAALLGVPDLPPEAFTHVGDRRIRPQGGGGSGSAPASQTIQQTTIPDYAKPYVQGMLQAGAELARGGYETYPGERLAQFTPLQQQSYGAAQGLQASPYLGQAAGMFQQGAGQMGGFAQQASQAGRNFTPGTFSGGIFDTAAAQQYMSPYMQNVVDIQKREAGRDAAIAGTAQQGQATRAGAFGGSRDAIMRAEANRNLMQRQGDIQAQGLQSAYQQAQQQFNADMARGLTAQQLGEQSRQFGSSLGLQGLQAALQGTQGMMQAGQGLAGLGGEQYRQQAGITDIQNRLGMQQQGQVQRGLDIQYEDFLRQRQHPYTQLGFMSDMLRGLPMSQTTSQIYQAPPSAASQIAGAGLAMYGLGGFGRAAGGEIPGAGLADAALARMRG